jgi:hypothetical protein
MRKAIISQINSIVPVKVGRAVGLKKKKEEQLSKYTKEVIALKELSVQEEIFCQYYVKSREYRGNGTKCYALAWGHDIDVLSRENEMKEISGNLVEIKKTSEYDRACAVCSVLANRLLRKVKINKRITELLTATLTNELVDARMAEWILGDDAVASTKMISEYNKLKQRITQKSQTFNQHQSIGVLRHIYDTADEMD